MKDYMVRFVYDNEDIQLDFCKDFYCTLPEYLEYVEDNLWTDPKKT
jgi:hypothetical protein